MCMCVCACVHFQHSEKSLKYGMKEYDSSCMGGEGAGA